MNQPSLSKQARGLFQVSSTSSMCVLQSAAEKTPLKEMVSTNTSKTVANKVGDTHIPSPFKQNLFWPGEDEDKKGKKEN